MSNIVRGYIKGYPVVWGERTLSLWDKGYLDETRYLVKKVLMLLPPSVSLEDFTIGLMRLTRGTVNPQTIKEVWNEEMSRNR